MQNNMNNFYRKFSTSAPLLKNKHLKNPKGKSTSSQQWLSRQLTDPYVEKAKMLNYRCRSAFKLLEINERFKIFTPGQIVIDCGAAPGSWTQVAVKGVNADASNANDLQGVVLSIDKQPIYPINGAKIFGNLDFTSPEAQSLLIAALDQRKADIVVSDMAPSATGVRQLDNENIVQLCYAALRFAVQISEINASFLCKLWQCGETKQLENDLGRFYRTVKAVKPNSSRSDSAEMFFLAREFKGLSEKKK